MVRPIVIYTITMAESFFEKRADLIQRMSTDGKLPGRSVLEWYDKEAKTWHQNHELAGYVYHQAIAQVLDEIEPNKNGLFLDIAAGSGYVAAEIKKLGFSSIDALDGSREMLKLAEEANIYRKLIFSVVGEKKIDVIMDGTYDGAVCGAALSRGHLIYETIPSILRTLKKGAHLVFTVSTDNFEFDGFKKERLFQVFHSLEERTLAKLVKQLDTYHRIGEPAVLFVLQRTFTDWVEIS